MDQMHQHTLTAVPNPVLAKVFRGDEVECAHRGVAAAIDASGHIRTAWGDADRQIFPRSMVKPIQAVALVASGAVERFSLPRQIVALSAASHFGEAQHIDQLIRWTSLIDVSADEIMCGAHKPFNSEVAAALLRSNDKPTVFHNNNCGKHLSLLTVCRMFDWPVEGYLEFGHPVQAYVRDIVEAFTMYRSTRENSVIDACGAPTGTIPLRNLACGLAQMVRPTALSPELAAAAQTITTAMISYPQLTSGGGRLTSWLMELTNGDLLVKGGSEGGQAAISMSEGVAVVVKIDDGAHRAAEAVFVDMLRATDLLSEDHYRQVILRYPRQQRTYCGRTVTGWLRTVIADEGTPTQRCDALTDGLMATTSVTGRG